MKVFRGILLCGLFIVGVFVSSANVHRVELVVWPSLGMSAAPPAWSVEVPLFVLVLACVLFGLVLGGAAALFEQGRLRWGLRRAERDSKRLKSEASAAEANMATQREEVERLSREVDALRRELAEIDAARGEGEVVSEVEHGEAAEEASDGEDEAATDGDEQPPPASVT